MKKPIFNKDRLINSNLRVNHAGEYGAKLIYSGQVDFSKTSNEKELFNHMREQEIIHLKYFENELPARRIRPSALLPAWHIGGYLMGAVSSLLGIKYSMICTEAVEEVIDNHYQNQIDIFSKFNDEKNLLNSIKSFKDDEVEHKEIAEKYTKNLNLPQKLSYQIISNICKVAIAITKKI